MHLYLVCFVLCLYVWFDVNYFVRTYFTVLSGQVFERSYLLNEVTTIYGICTFQDCDIWFRSIRSARLLREIDIARYHFYQRTGIYKRSKQLRIRSLQGCTFTVCEQPVPLFGIYKINTKLVHWDDRSLFLEHEVITLRDGKVRYIMISRQHALGVNGESSYDLLQGIPGSEKIPDCPDYINMWLKSIQLSSRKLRITNLK